MLELGVVSLAVYVCICVPVCVRALVYFYPFLELTQTHIRTHICIHALTRT